MLLLLKAFTIGCLLVPTLTKKCKDYPDVVDPDPDCPDDEEVQKNENNAGHFEGDMMVGAAGEGADRNAVIDTRSLWKKSSDGKVYIPYDDSGVGDAVKRVVQSAAASYAKNTCIRFRKKQAGDKDYIKLIAQPYACYSAVGKQRGVQTLSLGVGCEYHGTAVHELMHAIGFLHEQSRPDRDNYIRIHLQNVQDGQQHNFKKADSGEYFNIMDYDYSSIMHYGATAFSKNGQATLEATKAGAVFGQRQGFSKKDIAKINKQYDCDNTGWERPKVACINKENTQSCEAWKKDLDICSESSKHYYVGIGYCRKTCNLC